MNHLFIVSALFLATATTPALAHAHLASAEPADAAVLGTSPAALTLHFSEALELAFSGVDVTGPAGPVTLGPAQLDPADAETLVAPVESPLASGSYIVTWHALSVDGHKTTGSYGFTVK